MKTKRLKNAYPLDFKTKFGVSTMGLASTAATSFMTSLFMLYLTDYSGIGAFAAQLGTVLLLMVRLIDVIDDPVQGIIMDRARTTKHGKYRRFIMLSIVLTAISIICLFSIPGSITSNKVLTSIWVFVFYLMYDIGTSFHAEMPLVQSLSTDNNVRVKLFSYARVVNMLGAIPFAFFISIAAGLNDAIGDMHKSIAILTAMLVIPICAVAFVGISCVKEGPHKEVKKEENISFKDILYMFKINKALVVSKLSALFSGFVWTIIFATSTYFLKWGYCADLTTGVVDTDKFGLYTVLVGMLQILPGVLASVLSPKFLKWFKTPARFLVFSQMLGAVIGITMFVFYILGCLNIIWFFVLLALLMFAVGLTNVPMSVITTETMDYGYFMTGKEMHGICNAVTKFLEKAQSALSTSIVGIILIAIGYEVDAVTDTFLGRLEDIPNMLIWFVVVMALIPAILNIIASVIYKFYPITSEIRAQMQDKLSKLRSE